MNIAIDISRSLQGHAQRGSGVYIHKLIESLRTYEPSHSFVLIERQENLSGFDVIHYPYFDPFFLTLPLFQKIPYVVTVHDLIPLVYKDKFHPGVRGSLKWHFQRQALRNARRIITDSDSSRSDIAQIVGISEAKIDRIYLGPSLDISSFHTDGGARDSKYNFPYILYVGDVNWNKNILGLLRAFSKLVRIDTHVKLVLVGKAFMNDTVTETQHIMRRIADLGIEQQVLRPGYVSDRELFEYYANAKFLVCPSWSEGFGFPVIDAMEIGCPVVVSSRSSLKEIGGPSVFMDPSNGDSLVQAMLSVLQMKEKDRKIMIQKGKKWAREFTWENTAHYTVESYRKAVV